MNTESRLPSSNPKIALQIRLSQGLYILVSQKAEQADYSSIPQWLVQLVRDEVCDRFEHYEAVKVMVPKGLFEKFSMVAQAETRTIENLLLHLIQRETRRVLRDGLPKSLLSKDT